MKTAREKQGWTGGAYGECHRCGRVCDWAKLRRCTDCAELVCPACQADHVGEPRERRCVCQACWEDQSHAIV